MQTNQTQDQSTPRKSLTGSFKGASPRLPPVKRTFPELLNHRVTRQTIIKASYPETPLIEEPQVKTYEDLANKMSEQHDFLIDKHEEMKSQFSGHYMTQMNKKLIQENKDLKTRIESSLSNKVQEMIKKEEKAQKERLIQEQTAKIDSLEKQMIVKEKEFDIIKVQYSQDQLKSNKEREVMQEQIQSLLKEKDALQTQRDTLLKERDQQAKLLSENQKALQESQNTCKQLGDQVQQLSEQNKQLNEAVKSHKDGQQSNDSANKTIMEDLQRQINQLQTKNLGLTQLVKEKEAIIHNHSQQNQNSQSSIKKQQELNDKIQSQINAMEKMIQLLQDENQKVQQEKNQLIAIIENMENELIDRDAKIAELQKQEEKLQDSIIEIKQAPSPARDPRYMDEQEKQLEADMNFSQELLRSIQRSKQGSSFQRHENLSRVRMSLSPEDFRRQQQRKRQDSLDDYCTFSQNPKGVQYLQQELQQLKESMYSKLQFLNVKIAKEQDQQSNNPVQNQGMQIDKVDISLFLKEEVNQIAILSNMVNAIMLQSEEAFRKVHEQQIKKQLLVLVDNKDGSQTIDEIILQIVEKYEQLEQEKTLYKAEIDQNLDPKLKALISENQQLRAGKLSNEQSNAQKIETDLLKQENQKLLVLIADMKTQSDSDIEKFENIVQQLSQENADLLAKSKVLSVNLNHLAEEVEIIKEENEKVKRENEHIKQKYQKMQLAQTKSVNAIQSAVFQKVRDERDQYQVANSKNFKRNTPQHQNNVNQIERAQFSRSFHPSHSEYQLPNSKSSNGLNPYQQFNAQSPSPQQQQQSQYQNSGSGYRQLSYDNYSPEKTAAAQAYKKFEESERLNQLISDYKIENDKCTRKIKELKEKLQNNKCKFYVDRTQVRDSSSQPLNANKQQVNQSRMQDSLYTNQNSNFLAERSINNRSSHNGQQRGSSQPTIQYNKSNGNSQVHQNRYI